VIIGVNNQKSRPPGMEAGGPRNGDGEWVAIKWPCGPWCGPSTILLFRYYKHSLYAH